MDLGVAVFSIILRRVEPGTLGCLLPQVNTVALGDSKQFGNTPDRMILHLAAISIGVDDVPEDADEVQALVDIELAFQVRRKAVVIDRLVFRGLSCYHQLLKRWSVQSVFLGQDLFQL